MFPLVLGTWVKSIGLTEADRKRCPLWIWLQMGCIQTCKLFFWQCFAWFLLTCMHVIAHKYCCCLAVIDCSACRSLTGSTGLPACLLACLLAWSLACLPACLLACLLACLPACVLASLLARSLGEFARGRAGLTQCYVQILPKTAFGLYMFGFLYGSLLCYPYSVQQTYCTWLSPHTVPWWHSVLRHIVGVTISHRCPMVISVFHKLQHMFVNGGVWWWCCFLPTTQRHLLNRCPMVFFKEKTTQNNQETASHPGVRTKYCGMATTHVPCSLTMGHMSTLLERIHMNWQWTTRFLWRC